MAETAEPEPSMDEILASIRKIISEDGRSPGTEAGADDDALLLTRRADDQPDPKTEGTMTETQPHTPPAPDDEWVGDTAAVQARSAFDKLTDAAHSPVQDPNAPGMPAPGRTLEDVVRELLRPMLKEWLDQHLPGIVQERVDEEVDRITRRRVR